MADWLFNTNETNVKDAYNQMMARSVIALYGYPPGVGEHKLRRPKRDDRVFAYVNEAGVLATGTFVDDDVRTSRGIFGTNAPREFVRRVQWDCVLNSERGIRFSTVAGWGFRLPVRCTIADVTASGVGDLLDREFTRRGDDRL